MNTQKLIKTLKTSGLHAESPCGCEFKLSDAILFDGTKPFPPEVIELQKQYMEMLKEREKEFKKRKKLVTEKSEITTRTVNIGKNLEKLLPVTNDFKWALTDTRFLGDPIDLISFNGMSSNRIKSISFIEVKSGKARLNKHQKQIKEAIEDEKVSWKWFK